jgi:hypothetical protein
VLVALALEAQLDQPLEIIAFLTQSPLLAVVLAATTTEQVQVVMAVLAAALPVIPAQAAQVTPQAHLRHRALTAAVAQIQARIPAVVVAVVVHQGPPDHLGQDRLLEQVAQEQPQASQVRPLPMRAEVALVLPTEELAHQAALVAAAMVVTAVT